MKKYLLVFESGKNKTAGVDLHIQKYDRIISINEFNNLEEQIKIQQNDCFAFVGDYENRILNLK